MPFYENGDVRIHYEEAGSGFPLLLIPGGGLNSNMSAWASTYGPFNAMEEFKDHFRCITMDQRNGCGDHVRRSLPPAASRPARCAWTTPGTATRTTSWD